MHVDSRPTTFQPRPPIVDEYKRRRLAAARVRWRGFRMFTWTISIGAGLWLLLDPRNSPHGDPNADHVLKPFRDWFWTKIDEIIVPDEDVRRSIRQEKAKEAAKVANSTNSTTPERN